MSFELNAIFSLSIGVSMAIGWVRFFKTDPAFLPFIIYVSIGFVNELTGTVLAYAGYNNEISYNLFDLLESILLTWQFLKWGLFTERKMLYYFLQPAYGVLWAAEIFDTSIHSFNSYFVIVHSFLLVMMSISMINMIALKETAPLFKQPVFLLCLALILYFTYAILVEAFWVVGFNHKKAFRLKIYEILSYINLFTNLLFAFAFIWIPMRPRYILRS
jgi:hypothetical protein